MKHSKVVGQIYETTNYEMFKKRSDNRQLKEHIVKERMESIKQIGQQDAIKVSKDFMVDDGQHRLEACRRLQKPVKYTFQEEPLSTHELATLQTQSSRWKVEDHAQSFLSKGIEDYRLYNLFVKLYPEFNHSVALVLLTNTISRNRHTEEQFKIGTFKVKSYTKAVKLADQLRKIGEYYEGYVRNGFIQAFLTLAEHPDFEFNRLLRKIPKRRKELMDFSKAEDYIQTLEHMYNWKETKKVQFT